MNCPPTQSCNKQKQIQTQMKNKVYMQTKQLEHNYETEQYLPKKGKKKKTNMR